MRLAMLSWRYAGHPQAGGAELVTHEVLSRMAAGGDEVTCFTAAHPGALSAERIDGVRVLRRGRQWTVHAQAWRWLRTRVGEFDVIVDQTNTIPFLTPLYVPRDKRRLLIFQLAREYWWRETRGVFKLVAPIGYAVEPFQFRLYRGIRTITISASSRRDLTKVGIDPADIRVLPMASDIPAVDALAPPEGPLRLIVIGRLTPAKFVEEAVRAFARIRRTVPNARLDLVGSGDRSYCAKLEGLIESRAIGGVARHGRVDQAEKLRLLEAAHFHLFTSHREGWGLTVTEAAARGTPSVGYDAPGVRDSIAEPRLLAPIGDTEALAERVLALHADRETYAEIRRTAWERARTLSWDATTHAFLDAIA